MSYAMTVAVCIKPSMGQKMLLSNVQNATANKDYDTPDTSPYGIIFTWIKS